MNIYLNIGFALTLVVVAVLAVLLINSYKISTKYYTEVNAYKILCFHYKVTRIKVRSFRNGQPVGNATVISKQKYFEVDQKAFLETIDVISKPLLKMVAKKVIRSVGQIF